MERLARTLGQPGEVVKDPAEIVTEQIQWRHVHVRWLRERVQQLDPEALAWGITRSKDGGDDYGVTSEAKPSIWYTLYIEASRDLEKLCLDAIRVGLEARRVQIAEQQADMLVTLLDGVLRELGHDPNDPATAGIVERHLRVVGD